MDLSNQFYQDKNSMKKKIYPQKLDDLHSILSSNTTFVERMNDEKNPRTNSSYFTDDIVSLTNTSSNSSSYFTSPYPVSSTSDCQRHQIHLNTTLNLQNLLSLNTVWKLERNREKSLKVISNKSICLEDESNFKEIDELRYCGCSIERKSIEKNFVCSRKINSTGTNRKRHK